MPPIRPSSVSDAELEVLKVLWERGEGTVRDVESQLRRRKKRWAYTTILTLLSRLRDKGHVAQAKAAGTAHIFRAAISREQMVGQGLADLAERICDGTASPLMQALVQSKRLKPGEIADLRRMLDELEEKEQVMAEWLLENGIVAAVLAALVWAVCRWGRIGPVWRHALWMVVLMKLLMPPVVSWPWAVREPLTMAVTADGSGYNTMDLLKTLLGDDAGQGSRSATAASAATPGTGAAAVSAALGQPHPQSAAPAAIDAAVATAAPVYHAPYWTRLRAAALLMALWLAGAAAYAALQLLRIARMIRRMRASSSATPELLAALRQQATLIKVRMPQTRVLRNLGSPYVWCLFRPTLLWPVEIEPTTDAARALLVHELAHIRRRDHWTGWLMLLAGAIWWWNPVYWLTCRELRRNAEFACDGWAVQMLSAARRSYAEALLEIVKGSFKPRLPLAAGIRDGGARILKVRLQMIMQEKVPLRLPRAGAAIVALAVLASIPAWAQEGGAAASQPKFTLSKETTAITTPLRADGIPDYLAALNARFSQGVTPENNGFVLWLETAGTRAEDAMLSPQTRDEVLSMSGAKATPSDGKVLSTYYGFLTKELKYDYDRANATSDALRHARLESWKRQDHPELADYLARNEALLSKMSEAAARPKWWSPLTKPAGSGPGMISFTLPSLGFVHELGQIFCARAVLRAGEGDVDGLIKDATTVKQFSRHMCNSPMFIEGGIGDAMNRDADDVIGRVLGSGKLTEEQIGALRKALDGLPPRTVSLTDSIDMTERWTSLEALLWGLAGGENRLNSVMSSLDRRDQDLGAKLKTIQVDQLDLDVVLKRANHLYDGAVAAGRAKMLADMRKGFAEYNETLTQWKNECDMAFDLRKLADESRNEYSERVARVFLGCFAANLMVESDRAEALRDQELDLLIAAAAYHARNGQWPQKLADLVPGFAKEVPADFFSADGKAPLKYLLLDGDVRIYSVGRNGIDDGGVFDGRRDDIVVGQQ